MLTDRLDLHPGCYVAPGAVLVGDVSLGDGTSVWYGCVLRGDLEPVIVGDGTNVQDLTLVHVDRGLPARIGRDVTIGHRCVIHGCTIEDEALIGMGAVLLSGSRVGRGALVAAGSVVLEGLAIPAGAIAAGVPAKIRGTVTPELSARLRDGVATYKTLAAAYREGRLGRGPHSGSA